MSDGGDPFGGDPYGADPYRGAVYRDVSEGRCPRCGGELAASWRALVCPSGCGEWLSRADLPGEVGFEQLEACEPDVGSLIGHPFPPASCVLCSLTMATRIHDGV